LLRSARWKQTRPCKYSAIAASDSVSNAHGPSPCSINRPPSAATRSVMCGSASPSGRPPKRKASTRSARGPSLSTATVLPANAIRLRVMRR